MHSTKTVVSLCTRSSTVFINASITVFCEKKSHHGFTKICRMGFYTTEFSKMLLEIAFNTHPMHYENTGEAPSVTISIINLFVP